MSESEINTLEEFQRMVRGHDLTYAYSDDPRVVRAGEARDDRIIAAARKFDRAAVVKIWNNWVDGQVAKSVAGQFHWSEEP